MSATSVSHPPLCTSPQTPLVEELLASYGELYGYLRGRLRNAAEAADIAQSSFAQVYAHLRDHPVGNARALLFQAARNLWVDAYRRGRSEAAALEAWAIAQDDLAPSAERIASARQQLLRLIARIDRMPRLRREA